MKSQQDRLRQTNEELEDKAKGLGATAIIDLKLVQSQFQWNQRTSLIATAIKGS